jgi:hypothetical protein
MNGRGDEWGGGRRQGDEFGWGRDAGGSIQNEVIADFKGENQFMSKEIWESTVYD